ncbi:MAG: hypothetical protein EOO07_16485 [Chitinophagaceae bacterium]|nr:MAG: hypothetical protein EOO07_16485 [Chitinophagaceae bacterium]
MEGKHMRVGLISETSTFIQMVQVMKDEHLSHFVIRKIHSAYLVSCNGSKVTVEPLYTERYIGASAMVASSMQIIGNSKILLFHPQNPSQYLVDYYSGLGWKIEDAL